MTFGTAPPQTGVLRLTSLYQFSQSEVGTPGTHLSEHRNSLIASYAAHDRIAVALTVPLVHRRLTFPDLERLRLSSLGDLGFEARIRLFADREFAPSHLLMLSTGLQFPTAPLQRAPNGSPIRPDLQAGNGGLTPIVGLSYLWLGDELAAFASLQARIPSRAIRFDFQASRSLLASGHLQFSATDWLALRLGLDLRWDTQLEEFGQRAPDSGGLITFLRYGAVLSWEELQFSLATYLPVANALRGQQQEGISAMAALSYALETER